MTDRGGEREADFRDRNPIDERGTPARVLAGRVGDVRASRISISEVVRPPRAGEPRSRRRRSPSRQVATSSVRASGRARRRPRSATPRGVGGRVEASRALADDSDSSASDASRRVAGIAARGRVLGRAGRVGHASTLGRTRRRTFRAENLSRRTDERRSRRAFVTSSLPLETREGTARVSCFLNLDFLFHVEHMRRTARRMIGARAKELRERITLRDRGEGTRVSRSLLVQQGHRVSALS